MTIRLAISRQLIKSIFCIFVCTLLPVGCSKYLKPNPGKNTTNQEINQMMQQSYANNSLIAAQKGATKLPPQVSNALLPTLSVQKSTTTPAAMKRFNVSVKNIPINTFLLGLVKDTPYNIVIDPAVTGNVSLDLKDVTIEDALNVLHDLYGYEFKRTNYGYAMMPRKMMTRIFTVDYLDVKRLGKSSTTISSGQITQNITSGGTGSRTSGGQTRTTQTQKSSSVETDSETNFWKSLDETLKTIVEPKNGRQVIVNAGSGTVIVKAYPDELEEISRYLDTLESTMSRQVLIDAKVLEVKLNKGYELGVDWQLLKAGQHGILDNETGSKKTFSNELGPFANMFSLALNKSSSNFKLIVDLLSEQGKVQVLSSPQISTLNNQKAVIKVGRDQFFVTNVSSDTSASGIAGNAVQTQNIEFTPFFSGIALDVTPQINRNGEVTLHIHPIVSDVEQDVREIKLTKTDSFGNPQTGTDEIPLALSDIRESDTIVRATDGQTIVIGGLIENKSKEDNASTPGPDKIPIIGSLFRRTHQEGTRSELIILLRPTIVKNNTWRKQIKNAAGRFRRLNEGYNFGPHPDTFGNLGEFQK